MVWRDIPSQFSGCIIYVPKKEYPVSIIAGHSPPPLPSPPLFLSSTQPWIFLGRLQAHVPDSSSPETVFRLQCRGRGSCHTSVFTWRPNISSRRSSSVECVTVQCHLHAVSLFVKLFCSSYNCVNNTNYCVVVLKCLHSAPR